jgi:lauroyl/myristoyl acyltransferase
VEGGVAQISARLFGAEAKIPNGPFVLALVAQTPIYPLFIARAGCRRYQIIVREPIRLQASGEREADIAKGANQWSAALEEMVANHWEQWFAFAPIFLQ